MKAYVHSLESFGTVDGPGTRFVVFLKGCNLRCAYCHNPDTWKMQGAQQMSVEEILAEYNKVREFCSGGITVSGGEPLLQLDFLIQLFKECKQQNIHTALDTSGAVFMKNNKRRVKMYDELVKYLDLVLLDIKHINPEEHLKLTKTKLQPVLDFASYLDSKNIDVWIRHVVIPTITLDDKYLYQLGTYLKSLNNITGIEILPYHTMAINKYEKLCLDYPLDGIEKCSKEDAKRARNLVLYAMNN